MLNHAVKKLFRKKVICQNHETVRPKLTVNGRETRLVRLRDVKIGRLSIYC